MQKYAKRLIRHIPQLWKEIPESRKLHCKGRRCLLAAEKINFAN